MAYRDNTPSHWVTGPGPRASASWSVKWESLGYRLVSFLEGSALRPRELLGWQAACAAGAGSPSSCYSSRPGAPCLLQEAALTAAQHCALPVASLTDSPPHCGTTGTRATARPADEEVEGQETLVFCPHPLVPANDRKRTSGKHQDALRAAPPGEGRAGCVLLATRHLV